MTIKNGKKPLSAKTSPAISYDDIFGNALNLPENLKKELEEQGLEGHFIDAKRFYDMGGYHPKGWTLYRSKNKNSDTISLQDFGLGRDPEGVIRRGSLILAVKTKEQAEAHREFLRSRANKVKTVNREKAEELRSMARSAQMKATIIEGYEENE